MVSVVFLTFQGHFTCPVENTLMKDPTEDKIAVRPSSRSLDDLGED